MVAPFRLLPLPGLEMSGRGRCFYFRLPLAGLFLFTLEVDFLQGPLSDFLPCFKPVKYASTKAHPYHTGAQFKRPSALLHILSR